MTTAVEPVAQTASTTIAPIADEPAKTSPQTSVVSLFDQIPTTPEGDLPSPKVEDTNKPEVAETKAESIKELAPDGATDAIKNVDAIAEPVKPTVDWNSADNPYLKQYRDTAGYATRVNQQNKDLARQMEIINKKLDGTYDPEQDKPLEPSSDELVAQAEIKGKVSASQAVAEERYGAEAVQKLILDEHSPYARLEASDPTIGPRVMASNAPILEAMAVLNEHVFFSKYGRDPEGIKKAITKEVLDVEREKIRAEVTKDVMARIAQKNDQVVGLGDVRGAASLTKPGVPTGSLVKNMFG